MIFNSLTYLVFLFIVVILYWFLPRKPRLYLIFTSSLIFYGFWKFAFIPVMMASVVIDYFVAIKIDTTVSQKIKKDFYVLAFLQICHSYFILNT